MCGPFVNLKEEWKKANIAEFHIHIYKKNDSDADLELVRNIQSIVGKASGTYLKGPFDIGKVGPHIRPNTELNLVGDKSRIYLQMILNEIELFNRDRLFKGQEPLSVLVHPETGNFLKDHDPSNIKWFGQPLGFNPDFMARFKKPPHIQSHLKR